MQKQHQSWPWLSTCHQQVQICSWINACIRFSLCVTKIRISAEKYLVKNCVCGGKITNMTNVFASPSETNHENNPLDQSHLPTPVGHPPPRPDQVGEHLEDVNIWVYWMYVLNVCTSQWLVVMVMNFENACSKYDVRSNPWMIWWYALNNWWAMTETIDSLTFGDFCTWFEVDMIMWHGLMWAW